MVVTNPRGTRTEREDDNMTLLRNLSIVLSLGILASLGVPAASGQPAPVWKANVAVAPIPDPALPCSKQNWYNADRICLAWTGPHRGTLAATAIASDWSSAPLMLPQPVAKRDDGEDRTT
jgi:hypothetical protein